MSNHYQLSGWRGEGQTSDRRETILSELRTFRQWAVAVELVRAVELKLALLRLLQRQLELDPSLIVFVGASEQASREAHEAFPDSQAVDRQSMVTALHDLRRERMEATAS